MVTASTDKKNKGFLGFIRLKHWPLLTAFGYFLFLLLNPAINASGFQDIEIHYRIFIIFWFVLGSFGGMLLTLLSLGVALSFILTLVCSYFAFLWMNKSAKKQVWISSRNAVVVASLAAFIFWFLTTLNFG